MTAADELYTARSRMLAQAAAALGELGWPVQLGGPAGAESGSAGAENGRGPVLLVGLGADALGRERQSSWMFVPLEAGADFDYLGLVQVYTELPIACAPAERAAWESRVTALNNELPLGSLGIGPAGNLYHRCVLPVEKWRMPAAETLQQLHLVLVYLVGEFTRRLEAAAGGAG